MAYNMVSQEEFDRLSDGRASASPPAREQIYQPVGITHENLGGRDALENAGYSDDSVVHRLSSFVRSTTSNPPNYHEIEADEYEEANDQLQPIHISKRRDQNGRAEALSQAPHSTSPEPSVPLRTASISDSLPISSPRPDLQALQGAYIGNVERLEESAERLSMTSSIEEEIQKLKLKQRRSDTSLAGSRPQTSSGQHSNSIIGVNSAARSGGYSPAGYITSPQGSIGSGSYKHTTSFSRMDRQANLHKSEHERPLESEAPPSPSSSEPPPPPPHVYGLNSEERDDNEDEEEKARPTTGGSGDTIEQVKNAFIDFDGVHRVMHPNFAGSRQSSLHRQSSLNVPILDQKRDSMAEPPPGTVFYPAPVPMMLNLPQKLSKLPSASEMERRRLKGLSNIPANARRSAAWLSGAESVTGSRASDLPPQLRASVFFEHPSVGHDIEIKDGSAVDTLDSILDASAFGPVTAFVDHPIAGRIGSNIYGQPKERKKARRSMQKSEHRTSTGKRVSSSGNKAIIRMVSSGALSSSSSRRLASRETQMQEIGLGSDEEERSSKRDIERKAEQSISPSEDELSDHGEHDSGDEEEEEEEEDPNAAPTTLLAELQFRKDQQKKRNRTQAITLPDGTKPTLLEQDAIAQIQKHARRQKHITLAWEDQETADKTNFDDENIPLGVLYAGNKMVERASRPIGLMERRIMEENEPLSKRRARIRGEPITKSRGPSYAQQLRATSVQAVRQPSLNNPPEDEEQDGGETLAERVRRLKSEKGTATALTSDFATDLLNQFVPKKEAPPPQTKTPDAEETLGQRRRRLKEEAEARGTSTAPAVQAPDRGQLNQRRSAADLLAARKSLAQVQQQHSQTDMRQSFMMPPPSHLMSMPSSLSSSQIFPSFPMGNNPYGNMMMQPQPMPTNMYRNFPPPSASAYVNPPMFFNPQIAMQMNMGMPFQQHGLGGMMPGMPEMSQAPAPPMMAAGMGPPIDGKRGSNVERWRESVL